MIGQAVARSGQSTEVRLEPRPLGPQADRDLPLPKRPARESSDGVALPGANGKASRGRLASTEASASSLQAPNLSAELMRDLPAPLGPLPRPAPLMQIPAREARPPHSRQETAAPVVQTRRRSPVPVAPAAPATLLAQVPGQAIAQAVAAALPAAVPGSVSASVAAPIAAPLPVVAAPVASVSPPRVAPPAAAPMPVTASTPQSVPSAAVPTAVGAAPKPGAAAADRTAPEPPEAMEHRMYGAVRIPPTNSPGPGKDQVVSAVPPPSVVAAAAAPAAAPPASALVSQPGRSASPIDAKAPAAPRFESEPLDQPSSPALLEPAAQPLDRPMLPTAGPPEIIESTPDVDPPHLPMGWIIGALFMLALMLTLWIAHRAGAFGPPTPPIPIDPNSTTTLPRMP